MPVRAKFKVTKIATTEYGQKEVTLSPQYDPAIEEDRRFAKAEPTGSIHLCIDNPPAADELLLGQLFYVDFTVAGVK